MPKQSPRNPRTAPLRSSDFRDPDLFAKLAEGADEIRVVFRLGGISFNGCDLAPALKPQARRRALRRLGQHVYTWPEAERA